MDILQQNSFTFLDNLSPDEKQLLHNTPAARKQAQLFSNDRGQLSQIGVAIHRQSSPREWIIPLHCHDFTEIIYCRQAVGVEYLVDSRRYRLQNGDIICVPQGIAHRPLFPDSMTEPFIRDELWLSSEFIKSMGRRLPDDFPLTRRNAYFLRTTGTRWEHIGQLFHRGVQEMEEQPFRWENYVLGSAIQLFVEVCRALIDEGAPQIVMENTELFDRIMAYVEKNLSKKITLESTAKAFFVSKSTVTRTFQKHLGVSFYSYVTQRRLITAKGLILSGEPLESVAEKVGFSDYPTFYRAFKQEYGISPRQFRKGLPEKTDSI